MPARIQFNHGDLIPGTRLTFIQDLPSTNKRRQARFRCCCNTIIDRDLNWVRFLNITSCGCYKSDILIKKNTRHGQAARDKKSGAYRSWQAMRQRIICDPHYMNVNICPEWDNFNVFYKDMGDRPKGLTIERINNLGDYEPSNCRWATCLEQAQNTANTIKVTINEETHSIKEWCRIKNINYGLIKQRRRRGMSLKDAIVTPVNTRKHSTNNAITEYYTDRANSGLAALAK